MYCFDRTVILLSRWFNWVASIAMITMMFLVCANVILRLLYRPILGTFEIVGFLGAATISFGLAYTTVKEGHVAVDLIVRRFSRRIRSAVFSFTSLLSFILFAVLSWQCARYALILAQKGDLSQTLNIPFYPLVFGLSLSCGLTSLVLITEIFKSLAEVVRR